MKERSSVLRAILVKFPSVKPLANACSPHPEPDRIGGAANGRRLCLVKKPLGKVQDEFWQRVLEIMK
ncbi:MAG: hypothetical protein K2X93_03430 [Candidatus Obscuribacterales bacterium]|nr:hypothetical protein [Candidatus Obscuribacterales bacterium]